VGHRIRDVEEGPTARYGCWKDANVNAQLQSATGPGKRAKTRATVGEPLLPSSSDGNRKPPAISDRHKAEPKAEKCANRHSRSGRNMQHLSDHHDGSASQSSNGVKVRA
jgi:hypothetical protein